VKRPSDVVIERLAISEPVETRRTKQVLVRLTPAEYELLKKQAGNRSSAAHLRGCWNYTTLITDLQGEAS
jgi:hypothetical protein